ncbi:hypothetical protein GCM10009119_37990 [Algoriphagus jejuensis]|uniref:Lipoprotein n=1 Tax=Algoriphagus jejuensis TaxID=419934 RepID=A0ABP3YIP6_9BACT
MNTYPPIFAGGLILSLFIFSFSCSPKGNHANEQYIDSVAMETTIGTGRHFLWGDFLHGSNAVRVELDSARNFDWGTFRQKFHYSDDSSDTVSEEMAVGPWVNWNEFAYRRVYRYVNDELWIQTFYRPQDSVQTGQSQEKVLIDSQDPDYMQLGPLWAEMQTRGTYLQDSLR